MVIAVLVVLLAGAAGAADGAGPAYDDPGWAGQWGLRDIGLAALFADVAPSAHPTVAVIDSGVDATLPDLKGAIVSGHDFVVGDAVPRDTFGHGTTVALALAARADNGYGIVGACPICRVMPLRVYARRSASDDAIAQGIDWAVRHGVDIISVSLAAHGPPAPAEVAAVQRATAAGVVVVASAGNGGRTGRPVYPAAIPGVVSVTGSETGGSLYPWASRGGWVDLAAPGCLYYELTCGSSFATPVVAGAIALLTALGPGITAARAAEALAETARSLPGTADGRVDVAAAARELVGKPHPYAVPETVTVTEGTFSGRLVSAFDLDGGPFSVRMDVGDVAGCSLAVVSAAALYEGVRDGSSGLFVSIADPGPGRYAVTVTCRTSSRRTYRLIVRGGRYALLPS